MTKNPSNFNFRPFTRYVNRAALVDSAKLAKYAVNARNLPKGPVLVLPVDAPLSGLEAYFGVTVIDGCEIIFFDIMAGGEYYCTAASAGDSEVIAAMKHWDKAGVMPIWLETKSGPCGLIRHDFKLHDAYKTAIAASAHKEYLGQLQHRFNSMLEPGIAEWVVRSRTGLAFNRVNVGFLATSKAQPALPSAH